MDTLTPMTTAAAASLLPEWELAMTAENKSPLTVKVYAGAARQYLTWTAARTDPGLGPDRAGHA